MVLITAICDFINDSDIENFKIVISQKRLLIEQNNIDVPGSLELFPDPLTKAIIINLDPGQYLFEGLLNDRVVYRSLVQIPDTTETLNLEDILQKSSQTSIETNYDVVLRLLSLEQFWEELTSRINLDPDTNSYTKSETDTLLDSKANTTHTHTIANVTGLQSALDSKADDSDLANYSPTSHTHNQYSLTSHTHDYAPTSHTHTIANVTGLQSALDSKADDSDLANYSPASHTHSVATTTVSGFMSSTDKSKLDGIAPGATANLPDATLLNRANHTGTQPSSTISDFSEAVDDRVSSLLTAGTNITIQYNDATNTLTINSTASGGSDLTNYYTKTETDTLLGSKSNTSHAHTIANVTGLQSALDSKADDSDLANYSPTNHTHDYAPTIHSHTIANVTGLQSALDSKADDSDLANYSPTSHTHSVATTTVSGFMGSTDKSKLDGIAPGATANSPDATLLNRANHTGTQPASTISDFSESVDDRVSSLLVAGSNVSLNYNDSLNTLTINATASGGSGLIVVVNSNKTFSVSDSGTRQYCNGSGYITLTIPTNAEQAIPVGSFIDCEFVSGKHEILLSSPTITLNNRSLLNRYYIPAGATIRLIKTAENAWDLRTISIDRQSIVFAETEWLSTTEPGFGVINGGSGANIGWITTSQLVTTSNIGQVRIGTGSTATGRCFVGARDLIASGSYYSEHIVAFSNVSDGTDRYVVAIGNIVDTNNASSDMVGWRYSDDYNGGFLTALVKNTSETSQVSSLQVVQNTYYRLGTLVNYDQNLAQFFINGELFRTINATLPTALNPYVGATINKTLGGNVRFLYLDKSVYYTQRVP